MHSDPTVRRGHTPTLVAAFLHFDMSFMIWVLLGALGIYVAEDAGLSAAQKGLVVAVPILSGSLLRIPLGFLSDHIGGKRVGVAMLTFLFLPLAWGWHAGNDLSALLGIGLMLGTAGASFAVALPLASRWYPAERQGLVMGIAAAGNSGTVIANLVAPRLAQTMGWHSVLGVAMVPLAVVLVAFILMAKDSPAHRVGPPARHYLAALGRGDLWWFCLFYSVTFGGFVGLSSFLPLCFRDQYGVSPVMAGNLTALGVIVGSGLRPLGGYVADRLGGARMLLMALVGIAAIYAMASVLPSLQVMAVVVVAGMACLGLGNGAVFQLVPQRFGAQLGVATGVVGAVGGLGGFVIPLLLGGLKHYTGSFGPGFAVLSLSAAAAACTLSLLIPRRREWQPVPDAAEARARRAA
jgi:NNP family nitrate/nitrite transporter-like MFS transporter